VEKNEALESIRAIRRVMADGDGPLPVPPGSMIVWGVVSAFLIFTVPEIYELAGPTPAQKSLWAFGLMALATIAGSLLEVFVSIPVYATRQEQCYCARGSYAGLVLGTTALLWAFGPGIFLLFLREKQRREKLLDADPAGKGSSNATV